MELTISRYGEVSPTEIHSSGIAVSTPIYITLTSDQRKALLNRFRQIKQEQLATTNCLVNNPGEASKPPDDAGSSKRFDARRGASRHV